MATTHTPTCQLIADHMRSAPTFPPRPPHNTKSRGISRAESHTEHLSTFRPRF